MMIPRIQRTRLAMKIIPDKTPWAEYVLLRFIKALSTLNAFFIKRLLYNNLVIFNPYYIPHAKPAIFRCGL